MGQYSRRRRKPQFSDDIDDADALEDLADTISKYSTKSNAMAAEAENTRKMIGQLKANRYRTIGNKFFRKPSPPNLLTYAAKEQIRYLHKLDPEEWSVQALSDLFPVSEEIIRQTIKSKLRIYRQKEVLQHDQEVQKNWDNLMVSLENDDPAISDDIVQPFMNLQDEIVIQNATGILDLPFPVRNPDKFYPKGDFSAIVKDCYDAKREALEEAREELQRKSEEISALLSKVTKIFEMKSEDKTTRSSSRKFKNSKTSQISNSTAHHTEQFRARATYKSRPVNQERHTQETIIAQKYKDSQVISHVEDTGKMKHIPNKIDVKREGQQRSSSDTYIAGDCVYDKSGEFLYRIP
ncbi:hypothetical protein BsWGS_00252 [Bradybaena similaris]